MTAVAAPRAAAAGERPVDDYRAEPVLSAWSVASALGMGASTFAAGVRARHRAIADLDPAEWPVALPVPTAGVVPGFTVTGVLGRKGTRSMDRATGLAVATVGMLLEQAPGLGDSGGDVGLVLGTSMGSVQSTIEFTRDSLTEEKPYYVDPARFPNTVMNCAAGQSAIWHRLRGPNATIAGGRVSALLALKYAARLQACGHVQTVLVGAVEEFSAQRAWLQWHADGPGAPLGEACGVFLLEPRHVARAAGHDAVASLRGLEFGVHGEGMTAGEALTACVRRALARSGLGPEDVWAIAASGAEDDAGDGERAVLEALFGKRRPRWVPSVDLVGDTGAASAALQLSAVVATADGDPEARGRVGLVTSVDTDGLLGCALLGLC